MSDPYWGHRMVQVDERTIRCAIAQGFTEADVRDWRRAWAYDVIQIRMYNGRTIEVSGYDYMRSTVPDTAIRTYYSDGTIKAHGSYNASWWITWEEAPETAYGYRSG